MEFYNGDNTQLVESWNPGIVDAGTVSGETTLLIWNNRGGGVDTDDLINCSITTKDSSGGNTGQLVGNKWVEVRVDSLGETEFTPIGGDSTKSIGDISGLANSGDVAATDNYVEITLRVNIPANAAGGEVDFITRVNYQYI